jgi:cysteine synthase
VNIHLPLEDYINNSENDARQDIIRIAGAKLILYPGNFNVLMPDEKDSCSNEKSGKDKLPEKFVIQQFGNKRSGAVHDCHSY